MKSLIVALDFDSVMNTMLDTWVDALNKKYDLHVDPKKITEWDMSLAFPSLTRDEIYMPLYDSHDFWTRVKPVKGMRELIAELKYRGHTVYIVTDTDYRIAEFKFRQCLFNNYPEICHSDIIITNKKHLINCDVLVDDKPENLEGSSAITVLWDMPYNRDTKVDFDKRVQDAEELSKFLGKITAILPSEYIHSKSKQLRKEWLDEDD